MKNKKEYILITGASSGIGYEVALSFVQKNDNLILVARSKEKLKELKKKILLINKELTIILKVVDLSIEANVYQLYRETKKYYIKVWINNAGFGDYNLVANQDLVKIKNMIQLNITALAILSTLYISDYQNEQGATLINISSRGGYHLVPKATTYCATKFFVSAFTEGLIHETASQAITIKLLAPAATETNFGKRANNVRDYDYKEKFNQFHTAKQMAHFLLDLYESNQPIGYINTENFEFCLAQPQFSYAGNQANNQK